MPERALIIVDMQNGFCQPGGLIYVEQAEAQIPAIARAITHARTEGMKVIYTRVRWDTPADVVRGLRTNLPPLRERASTEGGFHPTAWGFRIPDQLAPTPEDHCVDKKAFYPTGLAPLLTGLGIDEVYVLGTSANNCVYAACLAAFEANVTVHAISDCVSSFSESFREPWLRNIDTYLGDVMPLRQFVGGDTAAIGALGRA